MDTEKVVTEDEVILRSMWVQQPLPYIEGELLTLVVVQTQFGPVGVTKEWFDRFLILAPDGPVQWRWLLSLLEEQVQAGCRFETLQHIDNELL